MPPRAVNRRAPGGVSACTTCARPLCQDRPPVGAAIRPERRRTRPDPLRRVAAPSSPGSTDPDQLRGCRPAFEPTRGPGHGWVSETVDPGITYPDSKIAGNHGWRVSRAVLVRDGHPLMRPPWYGAPVPVRPSRAGARGPSSPGRGTSRASAAAAPERPLPDPPGSAPEAAVLSHRSRGPPDRDARRAHRQGKSSGQIKFSVEGWDPCWT